MVRPAPPPNLSRREDSSPNSSAGPMIGAIFGIAIAIFILSTICIKVIKAMKAYQRRPQPSRSILLRLLTSGANASDSQLVYVGPLRPGRHNTGGPNGPNDHGARPPVVNPPVPGLIVPPPPTVTSNDSDNSGGVPLPPGIYPPGAWPNQANRSIPVDMRRSHGRDPRRTRSEHRR